MKTNKRVRGQFKFGLCIFLIITFISCAEKSDYPVKIDMVDGVKIITNPDYPRDGKFVLSLEEELSIGEGEEEGHYFAWPGDICVSNEGIVFVCDSQLAQISCFDSSGNFIRAFGREGEGPGEFEVMRIALSQSERLFVMDSINARISILDTKGLYINGFKILNVSGGWNKIYCDRNDNFYISKERRIEKGLIMSLHRFDAEGNETFNYGEFPPELFLWTKREDNKMYPSRSNASPSTVWIASDDGKLYAGYSEDYLISVYDQEGNLLFKFGRKYKPLPDTENWLVGISDHLPVYLRQWILDDAGNLWINLYPSNLDKEIKYDIFSPEGIYLKQVRIPYRIETIKNQRAFCRVLSEEGLPLVKRYRMIETLETN